MFGTVKLCKAFDRVWRLGLWGKMADYGYSKKLIQAVQSSYLDVGAKIQFQGTKTKKLKMTIFFGQ